MKRRYRIIVTILVAVVVGALGILCTLISLQGNSSSISKTIPPGKKPQLTDCSGHGLKYPDSSDCECFSCFSGSKCQDETPVSDCTVSLGLAQPLVCQHYWEQLTTEASITIPAYYRMGYRDTPIPGLVDQIVALHALVGNAETSNKKIVVGVGATQLIQALLYAFAFVENRTAPSQMPLTVYSAPPYYPTYKTWAENNELLTLASDMDGSPAFAPDLWPIVEIVTRPNVPDGVEAFPVLDNATYYIYDLAYYWPYSGNFEIKQVDQPFMVFSLSKMSGHAGTRLGWLLIDETQVEIINLVQDYIADSTVGASVEAQYRAKALISHILKTEGKFFSVVKTKMRARWDSFSQVFYSQVLPAQFSLHSDFNSFFLWIKCEGKLDPGEGCWHVFSRGGIEGTGGELFGAGSTYVQISFADRDEVVAVLLRKLSELIAYLGPNTNLGDES